MASLPLFWTIEVGHTALKWYAYRPVTQEESETISWRSVAQRMIYLVDLTASDSQKRAQALAHSLQADLIECERSFGHALRGGIAVTSRRFLNAEALRQALESLSIVPQEGWQILSPQMVLAHLQNFNVSMSYQEPQTMGLDRLLNALAVIGEGSQQPTIVISAGTAMTLDVLVPLSGAVSGDGWAFHAGAIFPGVSRLFHVLSDILPAAIELKNSQFPASNTAESLSNGLLWLLKGALLQGLFSIQKSIPASYTQVQLILCGGDTETLQPLLSDLLSDLSRQQTYKQTFSFICAQDWTSCGVLWAIMPDLNDARR
jgi:pantothenate kinase type III